MTIKDKSLSPIISLTERAAQKLSKILSAPPTEKQKKSLNKSKGVYSFYQKKWQKK